MIKQVEFTNEELLTYLQSLSIEVESRKDLMSFMISNNMDITNEQFKKYEKEYAAFYAEYSLAKDKLENYIKDNYIKENEKLLAWNLNFDTHIIELKTENITK